MLTTLQNDAERYVSAICGPTNGLGQCIIDGEQSHWFLAMMYETYGDEISKLAIDLHLEKRKK